MNISDTARATMLQSWGEPTFMADWRDAVFLHYAVPAEALQPFVPFPLDLYNGMAYVSCVAFTMRRMKPRRGGVLSALPFKPIATHDFLNLRTYVRCGEERGIYFLAEWLPNRLAVALGPTVFGLPYRHGHTCYANADPAGVSGSVVDVGTGMGLRYASKARELGAVSEETLNPALTSGATALTSGATMSPALTEFLLERYTAFTDFHGWHRCFRVWHPSWVQREIDVSIADDRLLSLTGTWHRSARFVGAHHSNGFDDVWMGRPRFLNF